MALCQRILLILIAAAGMSPVCWAETSDDLADFFGFGPMEILKLEWKLHQPVVADINHDGLNDLVVVNNRKARIDLLLQKKDFDPTRVVAVPEGDDINDIFGKEINWRFKRESYPLDLAVTSLVVVDMNRDGLDDLVYYTPEGLYVVRQKSVAVDDTDAAALPIPVWEAADKIEVLDGIKSTRALATGDLNNDQRPDLVLLLSNSVYLLLQQDDGQLARPVKFPSDARQLRLADICDVDGDGLNDLAMVTAEQDFPFRLRLQNTLGQLGPELRFHLAAPAVAELCRLNDQSRHLLVSVSRQSGRVVVSSLVRQEQADEQAVEFYPLAETEDAKYRDIAAGDLDLDGMVDVVLTDPGQAEFLLFRGQEGLGLKSPQRYPGFKDMRKLCIGRLAGSDKSSLVVFSLKEKLVGISQWTNGRLSYPQLVDVAGQPQAIELADINGDQRMDLVYISKEAKDSDKYFLGSILNLSAQDETAGPTIELSQIQDRPLDLRVGDVDWDGRNDILVLRSYGPLLLLRQTKADTFEPQDQPGINSGLVNGIFPNTLSLAPLGEKGQTVVLLAQKTFTRSLFFDADKGWKVLDQYQSDQPNSNIIAASAGKLRDADTLQIVTYNSAHERVAILSRQDDGTYQTTDEIKIGAVSAHKILLGHFNSPQSNSVLVAGASKLVLIPFNNETHYLKEIAGFEPDIEDSRFGALTVGDMNNDKVPDILLCDQAKQHVEILTFDAQGHLAVGCKFKVFEMPQGANDMENGGQAGQPRGITVGDVTGDGLNDLILLVHDRIIIYPQDKGSS